ncbi:MAG: CAP domain-containing protein, partial [Actinobacteria bacterium]|nr:CAP domain-containing protein [Actinomycetota bacterium]MCG2802855.1 CAP domain-containing protein [Cellulomonas sp.]
MSTTGRTVVRALDVSPEAVVDRIGDPRPEPDRPGVTARRRPPVLLVAMVVGVFALTATAAVARSDAAAALRVAQGRAVQARVAGGADVALQVAQVPAVAVATQRDQLAALAAGAAAAVEDAHAVEAASPHAGASLATLSSAADLVQAGSAATGLSPLTLRGRLAALAAARLGVVQAEAAWQAAEAARVAAEQAAADAAAAAAQSRPRSGGTRASSGTSGSGSSAGSAAAPSAGTVHAVSMACVTPAPGSGSAGGASSVGAAINAYRESNGLPALSVSTSGTLTSHALDMAASGGIWHSGSDNIVGCAPGSGSLVGAWSGSAQHNAQMLRTDVSSMSVGAASAAGYLFAAVAF